jgi:hypothetical protein
VSMCDQPAAMRDAPQFPRPRENRDSRSPSQICIKGQPTMIYNLRTKSFFPH